MKIFHQAGHNTNWNIDSFRKDNSGDGIIFSPVHYPANNISRLPDKIKNQSLFDPQYYIPDSAKKKFETYPFFPGNYQEIFSTDDFVSCHACESARDCINFQIENDFDSIIIPARYFSDMFPDYIELQKTFSVEPFLGELKKINIEKNVFLTLPVTTAMIKHELYRTDLLNWVTSYPEIDGVYLLNEFPIIPKQISDLDMLIDYVNFIMEIQNADLCIICGYCNTEGLIWTIMDVYSATIGTYENTRRFSINKFLESETRVRGPIPRLYFPLLLNWIRIDEAVEIRDDFPEIWERIYLPTKHSEKQLVKERHHANHYEPYRHHLESINKQFEDLLMITSGLDRLNTLDDMISNAINLYKEIQSEGVQFRDVDSEGRHLYEWRRLLRYLRKKL